MPWREGIQWAQVPQSAFWEYRWGDEFDACPNGHPDPAGWEFEYGWVRNDELQYYREEDATCIDSTGVLEITSRFHPEGIANPGLQNISSTRCRSDPRKKSPDWCLKETRPIHYTSSSITTRPESTGDLTLGQYDARIRIETEVNSWPAWWTVGRGTNGWPQD